MGLAIYGAKTWEEVYKKVNSELTDVREQPQIAPAFEEMIRHRVRHAARYSTPERLAEIAQQWQWVVVDELRQSDAEHRRAEEEAWQLESRLQRRARRERVRTARLPAVEDIQAISAQRPFEVAIQLVYVVEHTELRAVKVGIGSSLRILDHLRHGWQEVNRSRMRLDARTIESEVLTRIRNAGISQFLTRAQMPQGGFTETMDASLISPAEVWAMVEGEIAARGASGPDTGRAALKEPSENDGPP